MSDFRYRARGHEMKNFQYQSIELEKFFPLGYARKPETSKYDGKKAKNVKPCFSSFSAILYTVEFFLIRSMAEILHQLDTDFSKPLHPLFNIDVLRCKIFLKGQAMRWCRISGIARIPKCSLLFIPILSWG